MGKAWNIMLHLIIEMLPTVVVVRLYIVKNRNVHGICTVQFKFWFAIQKVCCFLCIDSEINY